MKLTLAVFVLAISLAAVAQQDLSSSNRDSTQNGVLSGTTQSPMRDDYGTQVPSTQPVAPSQTSAVNQVPANQSAPRQDDMQAQRVPVQQQQQQMPAQNIPAQPVNGVPAGTTSGTTQAPVDTSGR